MNIKQFSKSVCLLLGISVLGTSCHKYLDVNQNPNVAQDVGPEFLLPSAQIALGSAMGVDLQINGSVWGQYWTQAPSSSQYKSYEQYSPTASNYDRVWALLYSSSLEDLQQMENRAAAANQNLYVGISKLMKAYTFQVITDGWGDVPFSEALKGLTVDGGIVSPHFDPQATVYDGIIKLTKDGLTILNALPAGTTVAGDLIYPGASQRTNWIKFGNTLLLKIGLRLSEKDPAKAQATIAAAYAGGSFIGTAAEEAKITYSSTSGNQNPLYSEIVGLSKTQNLVGSSTALDSLTKGNPTVPFDARTYFYYKPGSTGYVGLLQGLYTAPPSTPIAIPSANTGADALNATSALAPVKFLTSYESKFLQAEAVARGWATGADDSLFVQAVTLSFNESNVGPNPVGTSVIPANVILRDSFAGDPNRTTHVATLTSTYALYRYLNGDTLTGYLKGAPVVPTTSFWGKYPKTGTVAQRVRHIITNKWFAMVGTQGFEAWTEWRRTGYPDWFHVSENSNIGKSAASLPHRLLYPDVEVQRNQNFPGQKLVTDRVYWDVH